ncbi:MAG: hypothetical protein KUG72_02630 [Pseudomonadales bacterium]|nr:hypothetical protein [Pseudomonadales bacterium]
MSNPSGSDSKLPKILVTSGAVITLCWFLLGGYYITIVVGWQQFMFQPADSMGGFLEGGFAPLAFLWLVIGYFLQQQALQENTVVLAAQAKQSHRDSFIKMSELVMGQLALVSGFLYVSSQGTPGNKKHTVEEQEELWSQLSTGHQTIFIVLLINLRLDEDGNTLPVHDIYFGTEIRRRHTTTYINTFEKLLRHAKEVDQDEMIQESLLLGTAHGILYRAMVEVRDGSEQ